MTGHENISPPVAHSTFNTFGVGKCTNVNWNVIRCDAVVIVDLDVDHDKDDKLVAFIMAAEYELHEVKHYKYFHHHHDRHHYHRRHQHHRCHCNYRYNYYFTRGKIDLLGMKKVKGQKFDVTTTNNTNTIITTTTNTTITTTTTAAANRERMLSASSLY